MNNFFKNNDSITALEAQYEAQKIAFAPVVFQVVRTMKELNILQCLAKNKKGITIENLSKKTNLESYAIQVLLETALTADVVKENDGLWFLTKTGYYLYCDKMTTINMDWNHHVNYLGLFNLEESIKNNNAEGLKVFGKWDTIYNALSTLPKEAKKSWFDFDHFYSDSSFQDAISILEQLRPKTVLDIGGNTGKFAIEFAKKNPAIDITIMDLPQQIKVAKQYIYENNLKNISTIPTNILLEETVVPSNFDIIWMSQFLDCFKNEQIVMILKKIKSSMNETSEICIMEPLWDRQKDETGAFCVINVSPYFTTMANGYSKMFKFDDFAKLIDEAGLKITETVDGLGLGHTLIRCKV